MLVGVEAGVNMVYTAFFRAILFYFLLLIVMRVMGKREIGGLAPIDLVVTIMMAELAAIPIADPELPILVGVVPIATLMLLAMALSSLSLRSPRWRSFIDGRPNVLVKDGKFVPQEMKKVRYSISDVLEQLRRQGYAHVTDVEVAILETDGNLSVIPRSQSRALQPKDLGISTGYEGLPLTIISDGHIEYAHLDQSGLDLTWLQAELAKRGIKDPKEVFSAILDTQGNLFVQRKEDTNWYVQS